MKCGNNKVKPTCLSNVNLRASRLTQNLKQNVILTYLITTNIHSISAHPKNSKYLTYVYTIFVNQVVTAVPSITLIIFST
jgi:hypothetical protein